MKKVFITRIIDLFTSNNHYLETGKPVMQTKKNVRFFLFEIQTKLQQL